VIPSPSSTILWQKGDCFDLSILLVSLLIGVGYDAYCVVGTAPREITLKNEALMDNPSINAGMSLIEEKEVRKETNDDLHY
jgi:transglutaminase-like putative cysteine protease